MKGPWPGFQLTVTQVPSRFVLLLLVLDKAHVTAPLLEMC